MPSLGADGAGSGSEDEQHAGCVGQVFRDGGGAGQGHQMPVGAVAGLLMVDLPVPAGRNSGGTGDIERLAAGATPVERPPPHLGAPSRARATTATADAGTRPGMLVWTGQRKPGTKKRNASFTSAETIRQPPRHPSTRESAWPSSLTWPAPRSGLRPGEVPTKLHAWLRRRVGAAQSRLDPALPRGQANSGPPATDQPGLRPGHRADCPPHPLAGQRHRRPDVRP